MDKSILELRRSSARENAVSWLKNTSFIEYARVIKVYDVNTVRVQLVVQDSLSPRVYNVRLLHEASIVREDTVMPQVNDLVLLLFLRACNDDMFLDPAVRKKKTGDETIYDQDCHNYNMFSGVGILLATARGQAYIRSSSGLDADGAFLDEVTNARLTKAFQRSVAMLFDAPYGSGLDAPVDVTFGARSPLTTEHHAPVTKKVGYDDLPDGSQIEFDCPDTETYGSTSPKTVTSKSSLSLSFEKASLVKMGDTFELQVSGDLTITGSGNITIDGDAKVSVNTGSDGMVLNSGSNHAVQFEALKVALQSIVTTYNSALAAKLDGGGSPGAAVLNMDTAKVEKLKV